MKILVIINPKASGGRTLQMLPKVQHWSRGSRHSWEFVLTENREATFELARFAALDGFDSVGAMGGDGTILDVIQGIQINPEMPLMVLPCGRGNDFARNIGISASLAKTLNGYEHSEVRTIDLPVINGKNFINSCGAGFDAQVIDYATRKSSRIGGTFSYLTNVFRTLLDFTPIPMVIETDSRTFRGDFTLATVANGPDFGGGMTIAPGAEMDDGLLDICLVSALKKTELLRNFPSIYRGTHVKHPKVSIVRTRHARITTEETAPMMVDGDLRTTTPADFSVGSQHLNVLIPA